MTTDMHSWKFGLKLVLQLHVKIITNTFKYDEYKNKILKLDLLFGK